MCLRGDLLLEIWRRQMLLFIIIIYYLDYVCKYTKHMTRQSTNVTTILIVLLEDHPRMHQEVATTKSLDCFMSRLAAYL